MGTVEFRVNGTKVAEIYFRNEHFVDRTVDDACVYYYEYYEPETFYCRGKVIHRRHKGITSLTATVIKAVEKEKAKQVAQDVPIT